jgi:hypothetical protein
MNCSERDCFRKRWRMKVEVDSQTEVVGSRSDLGRGGVALAWFDRLGTSSTENERYGKCNLCSKSKISSMSNYL